MMGLSGYLLNVLAGHFGLISFIVSMLSEETLFLLAILSGSGSFPFWTLFVFGFFGIVLADIIYFFLGHTKLFQYLWHNYFGSERYRTIRKILVKFSDKNKLVFLILSKFIYGTRAASALFLGARKMNFAYFITIDILAVLIWESVMLPLAWLSGKGIYSLLKIMRGFERFFLVVLLFFAIYYLVIRNLIERRKRSNSKV
jgi:membrane protein DedA with SNARE-associated domain